MQDSIKWWPQITVKKYNNVRDVMTDLALDHEPSGKELDELGVTPYSIVEAEGNFLTDVGRSRVMDLLAGVGTPKQFTSAYGGTGVGDSSANNSQVNIQGQTALQAATNRFYAPLDGAPVVNGTAYSAPGIVTAATTYGLTEANFAWNEWCLTIANSTPARSATFATAVPSGIMLNRATQALGTKVSTAVWVLQVQVTQS